MSGLATQQQALLEALFAWPPQTAIDNLAAHAGGVGPRADRGLKVYQANGRMLAERALRDAYPVVAQMLGEESFAELARALWHAHPPSRADAAQWGEDLGAFLARSAQLQDEPYLCDVACVEWALHHCALAADREALWPSLALLTTDNPRSLGLTLAPGLAVLPSPWPVVSLVQAHLQGVPALAEAAELLRKRTPQEAVVWRQGYQPQLRLALPGECAMLAALAAGVSVEESLERAAALDFPQWLPMAVQTGLVLGAYEITGPQP